MANSLAGIKKGTRTKNIMADWEHKKYTVTCPTCPTCSKERIVSRVQYWRLNKGLRKECKSCAETGNTKRLGTKQPEAFKRQKSEQMIGNQWAKGHKRPQQLIEADRVRMQGNKLAAGIRGEAHHSWKGGKGTERHRAMGQSEYKIWRDAIFKRDNYTCQVCLQYSGYIHADHIEKWSENESLRYATENGRTLCRACHYYVTFKQKMPSTSKWGLNSVTEKEG